MAKMGKNRQKSDFLEYVSNLIHRIFLIFCTHLENIIWHILVTTACLGKIWKWVKMEQKGATLSFWTISQIWDIRFV